MSPTCHWAGKVPPQEERWASSLQQYIFLSSLQAATGRLHPAADGGKYFLCHYSNAYSRGKLSHFVSDWWRRHHFKNKLREDRKKLGLEICFQILKKRMAIPKNKTLTTHKQRQCFLETSNIFLCKSSQGSVNVTEPGSAMGLWYFHSTWSWNSSWGGIGG